MDTMVGCGCLRKIFLNRMLFSDQMIVLLFMQSTFIIVISDFSTERKINHIRIENCLVVRWKDFK